MHFTITTRILISRVAIAETMQSMIRESAIINAHQHVRSTFYLIGGTIIKAYYIPVVICNENHKPQDLLQRAFYSYICSQS